MIGPRGNFMRLRSGHFCPGVHRGDAPMHYPVAEQPPGRVTRHRKETVRKWPEINQPTGLPRRVSRMAMIENLAKKTMIFVSWIVVLFLSNTVSYWGQATHHFATEERSMPLFEIETDNHIIITWANDEQSATSVVHEAYPDEEIRRLTKRPRDTWVISKSALGLAGNNSDPCNTARDCLAKASGDKVHAIRLYMHETGADLERSRKVIESNMVMGW